jgi:hypothetical protein
MCGQAGAEALVRQGLWEGAIAFAEAVRSSTNPGFFESVRGPKLHPSCGQEFLKFVLTAALKQARQADGCSDHMLEGLVIGPTALWFAHTRTGTTAECSWI